MSSRHALSLLSFCSWRSGVGGGHQEDMTAQELDLGIGGLHPFPCRFQPLFPQWEPLLRAQPRKGSVSWDHLEHTGDWIPLKFLQKHFKSTHLVGPRTSLVSSLPFKSRSPGLVFLFLLSLPSLCKASSFGFHPGSTWGFEPTNRGLEVQWPDQVYTAPKCRHLTADIPQRGWSLLCIFQFSMKTKKCFLTFLILRVIFQSFHFATETSVLNGLIWGAG